MNNSNNLVELTRLEKDLKLEEVRKIIENKPSDYKAQIIERMKSEHPFDGVKYARIYIKRNDDEIKRLVLAIANNLSFDKLTRIQAFYEILSGEDDTEIAVKESLLRLIEEDFDDYRNIVKRAYGLNSNNESTYLPKLQDKIRQESINKKWVYLIEWTALFGFNKKEQTKAILEGFTNDKDDFLSKVAKNCLTYLKAE